MRMDMVSSDGLRRWICNNVKNISIPSHPRCFRIDIDEMYEYDHSLTGENVWYQREHDTGGVTIYGYTGYTLRFWYEDSTGEKNGMGFVLSSDGDVTHMVQAAQIGLGMEMM